MSTLRITVEWLDARYHGREWPPAPFRLYQAMLAGYARTARGDPVLEAAVRHLETLPPPDITAPPVDACTETTATVPNNDADAALALHARAKPALARAQAAKSVTRRTRRARHVEGVITYDWRATPETAEHYNALARIARSRHRPSGSASTSPVAQRHAATRNRHRLPRGYATHPRPPHGAACACPGPGRSMRSKRRTGTTARASAPTPSPGQGEVSAHTVAYACALEPPPVRWAAFALRTADDRPLALEGTRAVEAAAMVRHAIGRAARAAGLDSRLVSALMGHGGEYRIRVSPLPTVGHPHADGCIRRVMLTAPLGVPGDAWTDVMARLAGAALVRERARGPAGVLAPLSSGDAVLRRFRADAQAWTTATPVVLPGCDHRRGRARPHRALARLLRHAGIAEALVTSATFEPAPRVAGTAPAHRYRRPRHLAHFPVHHLSVTWRTALAGPLALGAGTGYGLGLLVPAPD